MFNRINMRRLDNVRLCIKGNRQFRGGLVASLRRTISSLGALSTFEAAARLSSFTQAAAELGVTQAAVSRQIKQLEAELNTALFLRAHRRVELTPQGLALSSVLSESFHRIAEMIETIRQPLVADSVTVGATLAFTHFWLLPRLSDFRAAHPDIKLRLVADDGLGDLRRDRLDLSVRYGQPPFDDARSIASLTDEVFAVCSPDLLARLGMAADTADLLKMPLLSSDWVEPSWLSWRAWGKLAEKPPALGRASDLSRLRFNHYTDMIHAALHGEGVALGWATLISRYLEEGRLVRLGTARVVLAERYHLLEPLGRTPSRAARLFRDWLQAQFIPAA